MTRRQAIRRVPISQDMDEWISLDAPVYRPSIWVHVAILLSLVLFIVVAVLLAGGRFDLG